MIQPAPATLAAKLTPKQVACLNGVWRGLQVKEIGAELRLSGRTVETHLKHARETLGAGTSLAAARRAAEDLGWVRDGPGQGLTRMPPTGISPLSWRLPDAALSAVDATLDHDLSVPQRWLRACALAAKFAVTGLIAILALGAMLTLLSKPHPGLRNLVQPANRREGSQMSKIRQDARRAVAQCVSTRLHAAEGLMDDGLGAVSRLLADLPVFRKEAQLSATFGHAVFVSLADAQQAMVTARGHLLQAHEDLAACGDQLRLPLEVPPGEDKPPPHFAQDSVKGPLRLAS